MPGLGLLASAPPTVGYAVKAAAVLTNGMTLFTVTNAPILIFGLVTLCVTDSSTGATLQYSITPTTGAGAQTISNASSALTNSVAGASVSLIGTALTTAANLNANGPNLGMTAPIFCPIGTITAVVGSGPTAGTWEHHLYYWALGNGALVS